MNFRILQPDLSPGPQSTQIERPQGCFPGEVVIGEPEGRTDNGSMKMRSPHSNNIQQVDLCEEDTSDDSDIYIEEIPQVASHSEVSDLGEVQTVSQMSVMKSHIHCNSENLDAESSIGGENEIDVERGLLWSETHSNDSSLPGLDEQSKLHIVTKSNAQEQKVSQELSDVSEKASEVVLGERPLLEAGSDDGSRNTYGYSSGDEPHTSEVLECEQQSVDIVEEDNSSDIIWKGGEVHGENSTKEKKMQIEEEVLSSELPTENVLLSHIDAEKEKEIDSNKIMHLHDSSENTESDIKADSKGITHSSSDLTHFDGSFNNEVSLDVSEATVQNEVNVLHKETNGTSQVDSETLEVSNGNSLLDTSTEQLHKVSKNELVSLEGEDVKMKAIESEVDSVIEGNTTESEDLAEELESSEGWALKEKLPDQSDSAQLMNSSGVGEDTDDDSCESRTVKGELEASECRSESEQTLNERLENDSNPLEIPTDEIADSENLVAKDNFSSVSVETSQINESRVDEGNEVVDKGESSQEKSIPKRKCESSHTGEKKLKVDKVKKDFEETVEEKEAFEETISDEEELPDLMKLSTKRENQKPKVGDLVWVKYRKDWWPSYIKNAYLAKKRYSIIFVACDQSSGISVSAVNVKRLSVLDIPSYVDQAQEGFSMAFHLCKLFHQVQEQGNKIPAHDFFSRSPQAQVALLNKGKSSAEKRKEVKKPVPKVKSKVFATPDFTPKKSIFDEPDFDSKMSSREKNKLQSALKARKADNQKLIKYMTSCHCIDYLWKIYREEIPCKRHNDYKDKDTRQGLLWTGFGPFQLDDDDEQIIFAINVLKKEIMSKNPKRTDAKDYVCQVWIPEAIKEALRVVKKVPESKLDEALDKGYRETAIEKRFRKLNF